MKNLSFALVCNVCRAVIVLMAFVQPVFADQELPMGIHPMAMGGQVDPPKNNEAVRSVNKPTLLIRVGESQFDPLHQMPAENAAIKTIPRYAPGQTGYFIVQFEGPVQPAWKDALKQAGVEIFDYLPDFSFIVRMSSDLQTAVESMPNVRWVGIYQPSYRISNAAMSKWYAKGEDQVPVHTTLRINLFLGVDLDAVEAQITALGGTVQEKRTTTLKTTLKVVVPVDRVSELPSTGGVKWIEPLPAWKLSNDVSTDIIRARTARDTHGLYGSGQIVGVADTGLDEGYTAPANLHDDFEDGSGVSRVIQIIDRVAADETGVDGSDVNGHGTHVAGSVLGNGMMSGSDPAADVFPTTAHAGIAPKAGLIFQAIEDNDTGEFTGIPNDLNILFSQADSAGAHLHTNSWGAATASTYTSFSQDVDEYIWNNPDFLILFAAGNEGIDMDADGVIDAYSISMPATAKNCLTVGASEGDRPAGTGYDIPWGTGWPPLYPSNPVRNDHVSDNDRGMAAFSSRGPTLDGRYKPDLIAPGTNILSTRTGALPADTVIGWGNYDNSYVWMGGTSMATPLVAGAAALMREYLISREGFASPSAALIKAALINSAEDISPGQYGIGATQEIPDSPVPDNVQGWGRLSLSDGVFPTVPFDILFHDETTGLNTGGTKQYIINVTDSGAPLKINLTWTDYPGSPAAQGGLVNDLDLQVVGPSSTVFYPDNARQQPATDTIAYDSDNIAVYGSYDFAVRFSPTIYPAYLDSTTFWFYNNGTTTDAAVVVYGDNGSGLPDTSNQLLRKPLTYLPTGYTTIPLNLSISSGDIHIAIERAADSNFGIGLEDNGNPTGRTSMRDTTAGSAWSTSNYTAIIRANVRYGPNGTTAYDRVNNAVGVTLNAPVTGIYAINVAGYNVPQGPQPYALVASGNLSAVATGVLSFSSAAYSIDEDQGAATVSVMRSGSSNGAAAVDYATSDGNATAGSDYTSVSGTLNWADGDSSGKSFTIPIINDSQQESDETIHLALSNASGALMIAITNAVLTINANDNPGLVSFGSATYSIDEDQGTMAITVARTGGSSGAASVDYATSDGGAAAGSDYTAVSGTLNWADGDSSVKSFAVPIIDDIDDENDETIHLTLSNASGAALGAIANAVLTINASDSSNGGPSGATPKATSTGGGGGGGCFIATLGTI